MRVIWKYFRTFCKEFGFYWHSFGKSKREIIKTLRQAHKIINLMDKNERPRQFSFVTFTYNALAHLNSKNLNLIR